MADRTFSSAPNARARARRRRRLAQTCGGAILAAAALAGGGHAMAQSIGSGLGQGMARGPALPTGGRSVSLQLIASANYDSNIPRGNDAVAEAKGLKKGDTLYSPSARVDLVLPIRPVSIFLNGDAGYDFYQYNKTLQHVRADLVGGVSGGLGPCNGGLNAGYAVHQTDQADLPLETTRNIQTTTSYGVQASCSEGAHLGENFSAQYAESNNNASKGVVNAKQTGINGGITYLNRLIGTMSVNGGVSKVDYDSPDPTTPAQPGYKSYYVGLSLSRPIGARLNGSANISYNTVRSGVVGVSDYSSWAGQGELFYRVNPRLQLTLSYMRDTSPSVQLGFGYSIRQSLQLTGSYRLSRRLSASLGGRLYQNNNRGRTAAVLPSQITNEDGNNIFGSVTLNVLKDASISLNARRTERNTNLTEFNYSDYSVGVTATKTF